MRFSKFNVVESCQKLFLLGQAPVNNLGIIPEHLAEGIAGLDARRDEGLDSGSNPCTPIPTPFSPSPSPAQHSILAEQLAAGIHRLKVYTEMCVNVYLPNFSLYLGGGRYV